MTTIFRQAQWIGMNPDKRGSAAPFFRRTFRLDRPIQNARLLICGLGYFETFFNGQKAGDRVLEPGQTDYEKRCLYVEHDVTALLHAGTNAWGVILGDGWYNQNRVWCQGNYKCAETMSYGEPCLIAELAVTFTDGTQQYLATDNEWHCAAGPILEANIYAGETYDARREIPGWDTPDSSDADWQTAIPSPHPAGEFQPQLMPAIRAVETIAPVAIWPSGEGDYLADLGQNFSGWIKLTLLNPPAGRTITLTFAETINAAREIDTASTGVFATGVEQIDTYICAGRTVETWQPRFTYHGFRYVKISNWPGIPTVQNLTGVVVHTDLPRAGSFECSDERLNRVHQMAVWTHRSNIHSIPEDCPARERCGWLGDAHLVCDYSFYNFYGKTFWEKYLDDIETNRSLHGGLPGNIAPGKRLDNPGKPDWMAAMILLPWKLYSFYGDQAILTKHHDGMKSVLDHFQKISQDGILDGGYGDWCDPQKSTYPTYTPWPVTSTAWFYECTRIMAQIDTLLGSTDSAAAYRTWCQTIRRAFIERFYDTSRHNFGSQTADVLAMQF